MQQMIDLLLGEFSATNILIAVALAIGTTQLVKRAIATMSNTKTRVVAGVCFGLALLLFEMPEMGVSEKLTIGMLGVWAVVVFPGMTGWMSEIAKKAGGITNAQG